MMTVERLRCEYLNNPLAVDTRKPRFSWILKSDREDARQTAYRVLVSLSRERLAQGEGEIWDSGKVLSDENRQIEYNGLLLASRRKYYWTVQICDELNEISEPSACAFFGTGLFSPSDWRGQWIALPENVTARDGLHGMPQFVKRFALPGKPLRATAYVGTLGLSECYVNGHKIGDDVLGPAVAQYKKRATYVAYDLTDALREGENAIGLWLGHGWYRSNTIRQELGVEYDWPCVIADIDIEYEGGCLTLVTGKDWLSRMSERALRFVAYFGVYGIEVCDGRRERGDWCLPGADILDFMPATELKAPDLLLTTQKTEPNLQDAPLRAHHIDADTDEIIIDKRFLPVEPVTREFPVYDVDMGLYITAMYEIKLDCAPGDHVYFYYYEREAAPDGRNLTSGQADEYIARGDGTDVFRNRFEYRAGRYVRIVGLRHPPALSDIRAYPVRTGFEMTSSFDCSDESLTRLHNVAAYTYGCLSLGGYTMDCPARERRAFGGDAHSAMEAGFMNYDVAAMYTHWLQCWRDAQYPDGRMPDIAPINGTGGGTGWGGFCVSLPWEMYLQLGDIRILEESYPSIQKWLTFMESQTKYGVMQRYGDYEWQGLGDWLAPGRQDADDRFGRALALCTDDFFNNCFRMYNMQTAARIARVLGKDSDAFAIEQRLAELRETVHRYYYSNYTNTYTSPETLYRILPLMIGLVPEELVQRFREAFEKQLVETCDGHVDCGVHGTYFLMKYLTQTGRDDLAALLVGQKSYPSWGYMLSMGMQTLGEQWELHHAQAHSSFMCVGAWFVRCLAGIRADEENPGYKNIIIKPYPMKEIKWARAKYLSPCGEIESEWKIEDGQFTLSVLIPPSATALVYLPGETKPLRIGSGRYTFSEAYDG